MDSTERAADATPEQADDCTRDDERGQGMVEYAFIITLIAVVVLIALQVLGHATQNLYSNISNGLVT
jgi:pilus assembly protein Flp/PilA